MLINDKIKITHKQTHIDILFNNIIKHGSNKKNTFVNCFYNVKYVLKYINLIFLT